MDITTMLATIFVQMFWNKRKAANVIKKETD